MMRSVWSEPCAREAHAVMSNRMRGVLCLVGLFVLSLVLGCPSQQPPVTGAPPGPLARPEHPERVVWRLSRSGVGFRLSNAEPAADDRKPAPVVVADPLPDQDAARILARLRPIAAQPDDSRNVALRDKSVPPPRTGKTVQGVFPPPPGPPPAVPSAPGPLQVQRRMPEGEVPIAPHLSVTFSQPMVAITSVDDLARTPVPIAIQPLPAGQWRWAGAQTAVFQPAKRFPMATEYQVEVPAGIRSATGQTLDQPVKWTFSTPAVKLVDHWPTGGPTKLDPILFASFDQKVDPASVLATISVRAHGETLPVRLVEEDELVTDKTVARMWEKAQDGQRIAFRTLQPLPGNSSISVVVGPGTPSAEGPRRTDKPQSFSFRTYGPLSVTSRACEKSEPCVPLSGWTFWFSNPIDATAFASSMVTVTPDLPGMKVEVHGQYLTIQGRSKGRSTYKVSFSDAIRDTFGQTLQPHEPFEMHIGSAEPALYSRDYPIATLDPAAGPGFSVYSVNYRSLKLKLYAVGPEDWSAWHTWINTWDEDRKVKNPPGRLVVDRTIQVRNAPDELVETRIDLTPALHDGHGQVIAIVEPPTQRKDRWRREYVRAWVQVTRIGLDAFADGEELVGWATSLENGAPLQGVELSVLPAAQSVRTGPDGLAHLPLSMYAGDILVARTASDLAMLPSSGWREYKRSDSLAWYVFDDRKMYKPGEQVRVKGWVRRLGGQKGGDVYAVPQSEGTPVEYKVIGSRRSTIAEGKTQLDDMGGFDLSFKLPDNVNLGHAYVQLELSPSAGLHNTTYSHSFDIQEFRRPEFEVNASVSDGPHYVGGHAVATVEAKYYAGGGLSNAETEWRVTRSVGRYVPPNRGDFWFGPAEWSWWRLRGDSDSASRSETWTAQTDGEGKHRLRIDFDAIEPPYPMALEMEASVTDVNRQSWASRASLLVHPGKVYVGLRNDRAFVREGEPIRVDAIASDIDGNLVAGYKLSVRCARVDWVQEAGEYVEKELDVQTCEPTSTTEPQRCTFQPKEGGMHRITAVVEDESGRKNRTDMRLYVVGPNAVPDRDLQQDVVRLMPGQKQYKPGETAEILVMAPFAPAEGTLTIRRQGMVRIERFSMQSPTQTVRVPIEEGWIPGVEAAVSLVGSAPRKNDAGEVDPALPRQPAYAAGAVRLVVPPGARTLTVRAVPREARVAPGASTVVDVDVRDASGKGAGGSELALVVVDEAILALTSYKLVDPVEVFYAQRDDGVSDHRMRDTVILGRPDPREMRLAGVEKDKVVAGYRNGGVAANGYGRLAVQTAMPSVAGEGMRIAEAPGGAKKGDERGGGGPQPKIAVRADFSPLAAFVPRVRTDAQGKAQVPIKLPDNLTRYRIMAVAVAGERQFGKGESSITARLPLMVRPSAPRFLNFGDKFDLPVVLQNQTDQEMTVEVAARASNAYLTAGFGRRVKVPANDRVEVRLPAAAGRAGKARFQVAAVSDGWADASELELPTWTPATTEAFATYGTVDEGAVAQPIRMPSNVVREHGGLEVTVSSTALHALTDAVLYLVAYPFECTEQMASRLLAVAALKDVLGAFKAEGLPARDEILATVAHDIDRLRRRQHWTGGWDYWRSDREPSPYVSIHVAHALVRAKEKGFDVPQGVLDAAQRYLRTIESRIPNWYGPDLRRALVAYAVYVRDRMGDRDVAKARRVIQEAGGVDKVPLEAVGWLMPTLSGAKEADGEMAEIRRLLANRVEETAGAAHFVTSYGDDAYLLLHSDRRVDGILLESLIGDDAKSTLIPKLVAGLLAHRKAGHWLNTQENVWVLLALDRYFNTYEKTPPDFVARAWLGDRYAGDHGFKGYNTERFELRIPMASVAELGSGNFTVQKDGAGRLYYRIGMQYALSDLRPPPVDRGFQVSRVYEGVDRRDDVRRDADGAWHVKLGAKVRVRVSMITSSRRYHVALVDPIPAGLEAMNPELAVTGAVPRDEPEGKSRPSGWWWGRTWYEHQNMRDERVEAFASLLWEGDYEYTYVARATTPGVFVVPPPRAEEMYSPETFGRGGGDRMIVE
jgi:uncharacterized protein YfaS (alpha-2-macroglobulin family)